MTEWVLNSRRIALETSWDAIVVGGGPAGCAAAVGAAREGARTLLLEATGMLGGMGTAGLVPWFCGYHDGEKIIARGLAETVRQRLAANMPHLRQALDENELAAPAIDPELLKRIYDDLVTESGAAVRFHAMLCGVERADDGAVDALLVADKRGLTALRATAYVDATGDGDLATWAGASYEKGAPDGAMQPATHCFMISNIDEEKLARGPRVHCYDPESPIRRAVRSEKYPLIDELHACNMKLAPRTYGFNTGHVRHVDNTDPDSVSRALIRGRRMAAQYHAALAEYHPAFAESVLVATAPLMGVRETRRILGDYQLTGPDYFENRSFPDEICRNAYGIDVHKTLTAEERRTLIGMTVPELQERNRRVVRSRAPGESFGVPYRCLTPKGLRNVLVAGRSISADRTVNGSVRIMACCLNTGEAAGIAAAMAAGADGNVHGVDAGRLRETLRRHGAYLP